MRFPFLNLPFLKRGSKSGARSARGRLIRGIAEVGFEPFIQIDLDLDRRGSRLACITQQDIARFAHDLRAFLEGRPSRLLSGLDLAIRGEFYDAGELFFDWML